MIEHHPPNSTRQRDTEPAHAEPGRFSTINRAYNAVFEPKQLTVGLVVPIERYPNSPVPPMEQHLERARLAEQLGFSALWLRDVPFNDPSFGDAGQTFDPWVYLGLLAGATNRIALGVASIILPLRHPAHVAKAAATADVVSDGRLLLGVASGDRPIEYPALGIDFDSRPERFRANMDYISRMASSAPDFDNLYGSVGRGIDMLPKPTGGRLPILVTGSSRQSPEWVAGHGDGWITYPRNPDAQRQAVDAYRQRVANAGHDPKPVMQPLYVDIVDTPGPNGPKPIHLGFRLTVDQLRLYLHGVQEAGVHHVALNLRFNQADITATLETIAGELLPDFHQHQE